jgi:hypothetical protein
MYKNAAMIKTLSISEWSRQEELGCNTLQKHRQRANVYAFLLNRNSASRSHSNVQRVTCVDGANLNFDCSAPRDIMAGTTGNDLRVIRLHHLFWS